MLVGLGYRKSITKLLSVARKSAVAVSLISISITACNPLAPDQSTSVTTNNYSAYLASPDSFLITSAVSSSASVSLNFNASARADRYELYQGISSGAETLVSNSITSPYRVTGLTDGIPYYFQIKAINAAGDSTSNEIKATPIASFSATTATAGYLQATITWPNVAGATSYTLLYGTQSGNYTSVATNSATSPYVLNNLINGIPYYFKVVAVNESGQVAAQNELTATPVNSGGPPGTLTRTVGSNSISLSWGAAAGSGTITYNVMRSNTSGSSYSQVASGIVGLTYNDTSVVAGNRYYYVVTATNDAGTSLPSNEVSGQTIAPFTLIGATGGITQSALSWNAATGATNYDVTYGTVSGTYNNGAGSTAGTSKTISSLSGNTTYYFMVTATNFYGGSRTATAPVSTLIQSGVTYVWPFDAGTDSNYSFDSNKSELVSGVVRLKNQTPLDNSNSSTVGFGAGTKTGVIWDAANSKLKLDTNALNTSGELNNAWTPKYSNIVAYWKLNGTAGANAAQGKIISATIGSDGIFQNTDGSTFPTTGYTSAKQNQGITFDGTDDYISNAGTASYSTANKTFTVSLWMNSTVTGGVIFSKGGGAGNAGVAIYNSQIFIKDSAFNQAALVGLPASLLDGNWHHLVTVFTTSTTVSANNNIVAYIDGKKGAFSVSRSGANYVNNTSDGFALGARIATSLPYNFYKGKLDEVAVWDGALTDLEIKTLYEHQNANFTGTILSRVFDQGSATSWTGLNWLSTLPFGKELPPNAGSETSTSYSGFAAVEPSPSPGLMSGNVGLWHLNETSGTTASDSSGGAFNGTYTGGYTLGGAGKFSNAPTFNGTTGYISLGNNLYNTQTTGTISAWIYPTPLAAGAYGNIFSAASSTSATNLFLMSLYGLTSSDTRLYFGQRSTNNQLYGNTSIAPNQWHHVVLVSNGSAWSAYVDGVLQTLTSNSGVNSGVWFAGETSGTMQYAVGALLRSSGTLNYFSGSIDELGVWNRVLSSNEIVSLYQRGVNRVKFQTRVCTSADCSDDPTGANFKGPDGTGSTYFSEAYNTATQAVTPSGNILTSAPSMLFANFFGNYVAKQFFQYKAILESDVLPSAFTPDLTQVAAGPAKYDGSKPVIIPVDGPSFLTLTGFTEVLGGASCTPPLYQLSRDKTIWYYLNGTTWTATSAGYANATLASDINSNISTFPSTVGIGNLYVKAFLPSDTTTACEIDSLTVSGGDYTPTTTTNPSAFQITSVTGAPTQISLAWGASSGATSYQVCYSGVSEALANACGTSTALGNVTSTTLTGLTNNTQYYVTVVAINASGKTYASSSGATLNTVTPLATPSAPTSLAASMSLSSANLTWTAAAGSGTITYNVLRGTTSGTYSTLVTGLSSPAYTDLTALAGTTYYYVVSATNGGGTSANSNEVSSNAIGTFTSTAVGANGVATINWSAATGAVAANYTVKYGTVSGTYTTTLTGQSQSTGTSISGLTNGTTYYVLVQANNANGAVNAQQELPVKPIANFSLTSTVSNAANSAVLTWAVPAGATSYNIAYGTTSGTYTGSATATTSPVTITGLTGSTLYYFKVTAVNTSNGNNSAAETSVTVQAPVNYTWTWLNGTDSSNTFDPSKIEIASNVVRLANLTPGDYSNSSSAGFAAGTNSGTTWDSTNLKLTLNSSTSSGELNANWTPQYSSIAQYWKMNGTVGNTITQGTIVPALIGSDAIIQNSDASVYPVSGYVSAKQNQGIMMDGTDDYINAGNVLNYTTGNFSISTWFYLNSLTTASPGNGPVIFNIGNYQTAGYYMQVTTTGGLAFVTNQSGATQLTSGTTGSVTTGKWYHLVTTRNGAAVKIYLNGVDVTSFAGTHINPASSAANFQIGKFAASALNMNGAVDEFAAWNSVLSAAEVKTIYERQSANYTGTILSRVFDSGAASTWQALNWKTSLPFGKELTASATSELQKDYTALPQGNLASGLQGFWHLDEKSGTVAVDSSGNGYNGTYSQSPTLGVAGALNSGVNFVGANSGTNQAVNIPNTATGLNTNGAVTISAWVKPGSNSGTATIFREGISNDSRYTLYQGSNNALGYFYYNTAGAAVSGSVLTATNVLTSGVFQHVVMTRAADGVTITFYVNGVQVATGAAPSTSYTSGTPAASIGAANASTAGYNGAIDEVGVWNRVLTTTEITQLYNQNSGLMLGNVGLWHFNGSGSVANGATITNSSGAGNNATAVNANGTGLAYSANGQFQQSLYFDGVDDYLSVPTTLNPWASDFTISFWANPNTYNVGGESLVAGTGVYNTTGFRMGIGGGGSWYWSAAEAGGTLGSTVNASCAVKIGAWQHVTAVYTNSSSTLRFYVNGVLTSTTTGTYVPSTSILAIGKFSWAYNGYLDEFGIWSRALSTAEVTSLYQRGANRVKFQTRVCTASDCSDDSIGANWKGPDGSATTYFTEAFNTSTQAATPSGNILTTSPAMPFANFFGNYTSKQYLQYRAILESDSASFSPDIMSVSTGPAKYDGSSPTVVPVDGPSFQSLASFTPTLGASCTGVPAYQFSKDKKTWYWYSSGWTAATASYASANDATTVNTNIATLPAALGGSGKLYVKVFLPSDTTTACEVTSVAVTGGDSNPTTTTNPTAFQITSITAAPGAFTVNWSAATNATSYTVCYGITQALANACGTSAVAGNVTTYTVSSLTNGTPYYVNVIATDATGSTVSSPGTLSNIATPLAAPSAPTSLAAVSGLSSTGLTWTASTGSGTITYNILRGTVSGTYTTLATGITTPAYTDLTALNGTTYYYVVSATNGGGTSANSSEVSSKAIGSFAITTMVGTNGTAIVNWSAATGAVATNYTVKVGTALGVYTTTITGQSQASGTTIPSLTNGTTYYVLVQANNTSGSANAQAAIAVRPIASFSLTSTVSSAPNTATLTWTGPTGASTYNISYGTTSGTYTGTVTGATSPATISSLTSSTTYYFKVTAVNTTNGSTAAAETSVAVQAPVNYTWTWLTGTDSSNAFDPSKIEIASNVVRLANLTPGDYSNSSSAGFAAGTTSGTTWDSTNLKLTLSSTTSTGEFNANWAPQYSNIVGYWKLNGTAGANATQGLTVPATIGADGTIQNSDASVYPTSGFTGAKQNQGITFDGTDDYIKLGTPTSLDFGSTTSFSISAWVNTSSTAAGLNIISNGASGYANGFNFHLSPSGNIGNVSILLGAGGTVGNSVWATTAGTYNDGKWHHVLLSVNQTTKKLNIYVDGVITTLNKRGASCGTAGTDYDFSACTSMTATHTTQTTLGSNNGTGNFFSGSMDEVAVWKTALTAADAKNIFERQNANYTGTILSRVFDSGAASTWQALNWKTSLPFGKELTASATSELQKDYTALPQGNLSSNLVALLHFDEKSGTALSDASGTGNNGTCSNSPSLGAGGVLNSGYVFTGNNSGTDQYCEIYNSASLTLNAALSISVWVKPTATQTWNQQIIRTGLTTDERYAIYITPTNALQYAHYDGSATVIYATPTNTITPGVYQHVVLTRAADGKTVTFYVNGTQVGTTVLGTTPTTVTGTISTRVGANNASTFQFLGNMDEMGIWSRVLTATEITQLYNQNSGLMLGNVGLWHFNESAGASSVVDSSGSGNNGTPTSVTFGSSGKFSTSAAFDGTASKVVVPDVSSIQFGTGDFSYGAWFKTSTVPAAGNYPAILWKQTYSPSRQGFWMYIQPTSGRVSAELWSGGSYFAAGVTSNSMADGNWHYALMTRAGTKAVFYVDGAVISSTTITAGLSVDAAVPLSIGAQSAFYFNGSIDELALWNRGLSAAEANSLYQRGANRVKFQTRVCTAVDCSDDSTGANWKGPDGSTTTYFTEAFNTSTQAATPSGSILTTSPAMSFANFFGNFTAKQYLQYRAILESDSASFSPDIMSVSTGPAKYDGSSPTVVPVDGPSFQSLASFTPTLGASCTGVPAYQFSKDKKAWYWYSSGWTAATATYASANDATTINTNIGTLPAALGGSGKLYVRVFLPSDTTTACEVTSVAVSGGDSSPTTTTNPTAFQITSVSAAPTAVTVNWTAATNATSYTVCYGTTQALANACGTSVVAGNVTTYTVSSLTNGTPYYVNVVATDATGNTVASPGTLATTATPLATPSVPTALAAVAGLSNISLTWTASTGTGNISYNILRGTVSGTYSTLATGITGTAYTDLTSLNGTTYYYAVSAKNGAGTSANSSEVSGKAIGSFTVSNVVGSNGTAILTWGTATGATAGAYKIQYGTSSGNYSTTFSTTASSSTTVTGLTNGTAYYILVTATNTNGSANAISEVSVTPINTFGITATPSPSPSGMTVSWSAVTGATIYTLKYGTATGVYDTTLTNQTSPVIITGLSGGTTYYVQLVATNSNNGSFTSGERTATPFIGPPTAVAGTNGDTQTVLTWTAPSGAATITYKAYRATTSGGTYTLACTVTALTCTDTGLTNGTPYYYVITAQNASGGTSGYSSEITVHPASAPAVPTALTATNSASGAATLTWSASASGTAPITYNVLRSTTSGSGYSAVAAGTGLSTTTFTDTGLTNGTTYYYVVTATNYNSTSANSTQASVLVDYVPTVSYDFTAGHLYPTNGTQQLTFSRADTALKATQYGSDGLLRAASHNLLMYSQDFSQASQYGKLSTNDTISTTAITAPDGTLTGNKLSESTDNGYHGLKLSTPGLVTKSGVALPYTVSIFLKAAERNNVELTIRKSDYSYGASTNCNLTTGAPQSTNAGAPFTNATATMVSVGNGWYRCSLSVMTSTETALTSTAITFFNTAPGTYVGVPGSGAYYWGWQIEQASTPGGYTPTTTAPAYNGPRFDYDPVTHVAKGALMEEARTNLVPYTVDLTNAAWVSSAHNAVDYSGTGSQAVVTANYGTAPDGTSSASRVQLNLNAGANASVGTNRSGIYQSLTVTSGAIYTASFYLKFLDSNTPASFPSNTFNSGLSAGQTPTYTFTSVGNGWYRCVQTNTATTTGSVTFRIQLLSNTGSTLSSLDMLIWGAQLELGAFATSYIPNIGNTTNARAADVFSLPAGTWYTGATERNLFNRFSTFAPPNSAVVQNVIRSNTAGSAYTRVRVTNSIRAQVVDASAALILNVGNSSASTYTTYNTLLRLTPGNLNMFLSGSGSTAANATPVVPTTWYLGTNSSSAENLNGWMQAFRFYSDAIPDTDAARLTP